MSGGFSFFGPPPTPEEIEEAKKKRLLECKSREETFRTALPIVRDIRRHLHELYGFGLAGPHLEKATKHVVLLEELIERSLIVPPPT